MKRGFCLVVILVAGMIAVGFAASHGPVGLGFQIGAPTGITAKFWLGNNSAIDATLGWGWNPHYDYDWFAFQAGYLWHFPISASLGAGSLATYIGVGGLLAGGPNFNHPVYPGYNVGLAARIPLGLEFIYSPISFYAEVDPLIFLLPGTYFNVGGGIGFRFYF